MIIAFSLEQENQNNTYNHSIKQKWNNKYRTKDTHEN